MADAEIGGKHLDQQLAGVARELKRLRGVAKMTTDLYKYQWEIAHVLLVLAHGEPTAAMGFIRLKASTKPDVDAFVARAQDRLLAWWRDTPDDTKNKLVQEEGESQPPHKSVAAAKKFLVQYNLQAWVERQNLEKGLTPISPLVRNQALVCAREQGVPFPIKTKHVQKWMQRWRTRHGLRLRVLPTKEPLTIIQMHEKVTQDRTLSVVKKTAAAPKNVDPRPAETKKVWPFSGPNFGPTFVTVSKTRQQQNGVTKIGAVF